MKEYNYLRPFGPNDRGEAAKADPAELIRIIADEESKYVGRIARVRRWDWSDCVVEFEDGERRIVYEDEWERAEDPGWSK